MRGKDERDDESARRPSSRTGCRSEYAALAAVGSVRWAGWRGIRAGVGANRRLCRRRELVVTFCTVPAVLCTPPVADLRLFPGERADRRGLVSNRRLVDGTDRTLSTHGYLRRDFGGHDSHVAGRRASIHAPGCDRARRMTDRSMWRCALGLTIPPSLLRGADQVIE